MTNKASQKTTREKAAAAKAEADARQRRADTRNRLLGLLVVVALVALIFGGVYISKRGNETPAANPASALPAGVVPPDYGVAYGAGTAAVPQLQLWEDFQCSACEALEKTNGPGIRQLADQGVFRLLWRPTTILDDNLGNTDSIAATNAWGCAIDAGKGPQFHTTVFNNWAPEGQGYPQTTLLQFGKDAGITGDAYTKFESCVKAGTYDGWVALSRQGFDASGASGTPTGFLVMAGKQPKELTSDVLADNTKLKAAVAAYEKS